MKTILAWAAVIFIAWWITTDPAGAAQAAHHIGTLASRVAHGLATTISNL